MPQAGNNVRVIQNGPACRRQMLQEEEELCQWAGRVCWHLQDEVSTLSFGVRVGWWACALRAILEDKESQLGKQSHSDTLVAY